MSSSTPKPIAKMPSPIAPTTRADATIQIMAICNARTIRKPHSLTAPTFSLCARKRYAMATTAM